MLLDPAVRTAAAGALAAEPPAALVDGDRLELFAPARLAQPPRRGEPGHAAAEDGDARRRSPRDHRRQRSAGRVVDPRARTGRRRPGRARELETAASRSGDRAVGLSRRGQCAACVSAS